MRRVAAILVAATAWLCGACGSGPEDRAARPGSAPAAEPEGRVLARVDGEPILAEEALGTGARARHRDGGAALDTLIARRLAATEARRRRLDASDGVRERLTALRREAAAREEALLRDALFAAIRDALPIPEEELRGHYERTLVRYTERRIRLRRAAFPSAEAARQAEGRLGPEGRLDPLASEELGPASIADLPQSVLPEALQLRDPGDRVRVERDDGAALLELVEVLPAEPLPFEKVRERVEASLRRQRGQEAFRAELARLREQARIEIDQDALREAATTADIPRG